MAEPGAIIALIQTEIRANFRLRLELQGCVSRLLREHVFDLVLLTPEEEGGHGVSPEDLNEAINKLTVGVDPTLSPVGPPEPAVGFE